MTRSTASVWMLLSVLPFAGVLLASGCSKPAENLTPASAVSGPSTDVTLKEFDDLKPNMSYQDVVKAVGVPATSPKGEPPAKGMATMSWINKDGSKMDAYFSDGKLMRREQSNLK